MLFTSSVFILFFLPILFLCYFIIPGKCIRIRNLVLLIFSLVFYGWGSVKYLSLLIISIILNYTGGVLVGTLTNVKYKKTALAVTVTANLGLLGVFKYAGFIAETINSIGINIPIPQIVLPIGISFFTFQGLSYVVDVYRKDAAVQKNPLYVGLYISLFPQLVAGPIVRYTDVEAEIVSRKHTLSDFSDGAVRFMIGFGKKMLMANAMGGIADKIFAYSGTDLLNTEAAWIGAVAYTFQIYFDFSAYSDMAIGLGLMFGFHFKENFNYPYISTSVTEFWRRWHISLSTWFRDYVYIPLGGSYCSVGRNIFNLSVVWMLTGMWHGAAWTFILWGVYYGVLLILEKYVFNKILEKIPSIFMYLPTIFIVIIGWVIFRSPGISEAGRFLAAMFGFGGMTAGPGLYYLHEFAFEWIICLIGIFPIKLILEKGLSIGEKNHLIFLVTKLAPKIFALSVFILSYMKLVSGSFNPFIYFQF